MRYLKKKVRLRLEEADSEYSDLKVKQGPLNLSNSEVLSTTSFDTKTPQYIRSRSDPSIALRGPRKNRTQADADSKNIIKNYGKALCAFASSKLAVPYIEDVIKKERYIDFNIPRFMDYMKAKKLATNSMENLRSLLIEEEGDSEEQKMYKKVFKDVSIVFIKYFSVNWIFSGKLYHKIVHLKFRFKMQRRIEQPEMFTYLKTAVKS